MVITVEVAKVVVNMEVEVITAVDLEAGLAVEAIMVAGTQVAVEKGNHVGVRMTMLIGTQINPVCFTVVNDG